MFDQVVEEKQVLETACHMRCHFPFLNCASLWFGFPSKKGYPTWHLIWDTILPLEIAAHMQPKVPVPIIGQVFFPPKSAKRDAICLCSTPPNERVVMVRHSPFDHLATCDSQILVPVGSVPLVPLDFLTTWPIVKISQRAWGCGEVAVVDVVDTSKWITWWSILSRMEHEENRQALRIATQVSYQSCLTSEARQSWHQFFCQIDVRFDHSQHLFC